MFLLLLQASFGYFRSIQKINDLLCLTKLNGAF